MVEKNILLTKKGQTGETIVLKPVTSISNVTGLREYISSRLDHFLTRIRGIFVEKQAGKELSSNDFTDSYKEKIDNLEEKTIKNLTVNGEVVETIDGTVTINTEAIVETLDDGEIEDLFKSI